MRKKIMGIAFIVALVWFLVLGGAFATEDEPVETDLSIIEKIPVQSMAEKPDIREVALSLEEESVVKAWDDIPLEFETQVAMYDKCEELGISYWFMLALLESESSYRANAKGDGGNSVGYMQINKVNWQRMKDDYGLDVHEPLDNIFCGCYMVKELMDKYDTLAEVVMGYKCGESRMKKLLKDGVVLKSVEKVTNRAIELENGHR